MALQQAIEKAKEEDPLREFQNTQPELKGAKLLWHVQSQSEISPSYVYNPRERVFGESPKKVPTKKSEKNDFHFNMDDLKEGTNESGNWDSPHKDTTERYQETIETQGDMASKKVNLNAC